MDGMSILVTMVTTAGRSSYLSGCYLLCLALCLVPATSGVSIGGRDPGPDPRGIQQEHVITPGGVDLDNRLAALKVSLKKLV